MTNSRVAIGIGIPDCRVGGSEKRIARWVANIDQSWIQPVVFVFSDYGTPADEIRGPRVELVCLYGDGSSNWRQVCL